MLFLRVVLLTVLAGSLFKSPAWLSIEAPVNPYDPATRGAALLVHAQLRDGSAPGGNLTGTAEGLVNGARRSVALQFEPTKSPTVFAVRRQWPSDGAWLLRISLAETTAIVTLDAAGNVTGARVPTESRGDMPLPRVVTAKEIDSTLAAAVKR